MLTHAWYLQNNHIFSYKTTFSFLHHSLFCVFSTYPACSENIFTHKISGEKKTIEGTPHTSVSTVYFLKCQISIYWNIGMLCWAEVKMLPDNLLQQQVFINTCDWKWSMITSTPKCKSKSESIQLHSNINITIKRVILLLGVCLLGLLLFVLTSPSVSPVWSSLTLWGSAFKEPLRPPLLHIHTPLANHMAVWPLTVGYGSCRVLICASKHANKKHKDYTLEVWNDSSINQLRNSTSNQCQTKRENIFRKSYECCLTVPEQRTRPGAHTYTHTHRNTMESRATKGQFKATLCSIFNLKTATKSFW